MCVCARSKRQTYVDLDCSVTCQLTAIWHYYRAPKRDIVYVCVYVRVGGWEVLSVSRVQL